MRRTWLLLALAAGCSAPPPPRTVSELSESEAHAANLSEAFDRLLGEPWLDFKFEGKMTDRDGREFVARGVTRWFRGGVLLIEDENLSVLRVGSMAWAFDNQLSAWTAYVGKGRPGTGFQNPYDVVIGLQSERKSFKPAPRECDLAPWFDYELDPAPSRVAEVFLCLMPELTMNAISTRMKAVVLKEHRGIGAVEVKGTLFGKRGGKDEALQVHVRLVRRFSEGRPPMTFENVGVPFTAEMQAAIQRAQGNSK